jgi:hypothetical protein
MVYRVFVSYGWHDRWIARQMANLIAASGAEPFIDIYDVRKGDRILDRVEQGIKSADELIALLTPWSVDRNWVWVEMASAWGQGKRYTGVLYGLTTEKIDKEHGGVTILGPTNLAILDEFDDYLAQLRARLTAKDAP